MLTVIAISIALGGGVFLVAEESIRSFAYKGKAGVILAGERSRMLEECLAAWQERPLVGYGFGLSHRINTEAVETLLQTGGLAGAVGELGSSSLGLLLGGGVPLLASFYGLVGSIGLYSYNTFFLPHVSSAVRNQLRALLAGCIGLLMSMQSENYLMAPLSENNFLFWFYTGVLLTTCRTAIGSMDTPASTRQPLETGDRSRFLQPAPAPLRSPPNPSWLSRGRLVYPTHDGCGKATASALLLRAGKDTN